MMIRVHCFLSSPVAKLSRLALFEPSSIDPRHVPHAKVLALRSKRAPKEAEHLLTASTLHKSKQSFTIADLHPSSEDVSEKNNTGDFQHISVGKIVLCGSPFFGGDLA